MSERAHVCIIDDDEAVREALRVLLFAEGYQSCQFASADEFLALESEPEVDVILLDIRMPGMDGMELHKELIARKSKIPVIFITGHGDIPLAVAAIQRGAFDFLTKPFENGELMEKIDAAIQRYRETREALEELEELQGRFSSLTARETDVMMKIIAGYSNKKVANTLNISPRTVEIHRSRVMEKMGADSVAVLVRMAGALGIES